MAYMTRLLRIPMRAPARARRRTFAGLMVMLLVVGGWVVASGGVEGAHQASAQTVPSGAAPKPSPNHPKAKPPAQTKPAGRGPLADLAAQGEPVYCGAGTKPLVALTFDDGPGILSPEALRTLGRTNTPATFFLVGKLFAEPAFVDIAKSEAAAGMAFGDHTWDHVDMTKGNANTYAQQVGRTRHVIQRTTGEPVRLFRPPYGLHDRGLDNYIRSQGMLEIMWSIDSLDSQGATARQIVQTVRRGLSPGDIIILHDNRSTTETALPKIIAMIDERGLTPVTVPELLAQDPPTRGQLRHHTCN
jgi:peptidoglycan/xylan/chitin deacetylase (PgdA/CDA1 family)